MYTIVVARIGWIEPLVHSSRLYRDNVCLDVKPRFYHHDANWDADVP